MLPAHATETELASAARSILSCPATISLVVEGYDDLPELAHVGLTATVGVPTFSCPQLSSLSAAGRARRGALLTIESGLAGLPASIVISGRLITRRRERCECCEEERDVVELEPAYVVLDTIVDGGHIVRRRVPIPAFRSAEHHLNPGFLQRSCEHANDCHQDELRIAVAQAAGTTPADVLGVQLAGLTSSGLLLRWVDAAGAHERPISFSRPARSTTELGRMLREELHAGIC